MVDAHEQFVCTLQIKNKHVLSIFLFQKIIFISPHYYLLSIHKNKIHVNKTNTQLKKAPFPQFLGQDVVELTTDDKMTLIDHKMVQKVDSQWES